MVRGMLDIPSKEKDKLLHLSPATMKMEARGQVVVSGFWRHPEFFDGPHPE